MLAETAVNELINSSGNNREMLAYLWKENIYGKKKWTIDAYRAGNEARFINHSCEPNLISEQMADQFFPTGFKRIIFRANRDIKAGG